MKRVGLALLLAGCSTAPPLTPDLRLFHAIWTRDDAGVEAALRDGAEPNVAPEAAYGARGRLDSRRGNTPLFQAVESNASLRTFRALLGAGARADDAGPYGDTPLSGVFWDSQRVDVAVELIGAMHRPNRPLVLAGVDPRRTTIFHLAVREPRLVEALLAKGVDPNLRDESGETALAAAWKGGHTASARLLQAAGARSP